MFRHLLLPATLALAADPCELRPTAGDTGYKWRDNRCEGEYIQSVAGSTDLRLVSFGAPLDAAALAGPGLKLAWKSPEPGLRIRAQSLRNRHYYRMDAQASGSTFAWDTRLLRQLRLQPAEVGLVAWKESGGESRFVPLEVNGARGIAVVVRPGAELREVYMTLRREDARAADALVRDKPLGLGVYPAERGFRVALPKVPAPGWYRLSLAAVLRHGGSANGSFLLLLPATP
jgi:hypothetical protein